MTYTEITDKMARKIASRRTIGRFDFSRDSYDMDVARARSWRVFSRVKHGRRMTIAEAMRE